MTAAIDRLMALADALVSQLAAAVQDDGKTPLLPAGSSVAWQDDPVEDLADAALTNPLIWVTDLAETEETKSYNGVCVRIAEFELLLIVQQKLPTNQTADERQTLCRTLSALVSTIRQFCRNAVLAVDGTGAVCTKTERETARNFEAYTEDRLFKAGITTTWRAVFEEGKD